MRLFCLPHAGSGAAGFYRWRVPLRRHELDVCPVLLPGRESRLRERSLERAEDVVVGLMQTSTALLASPYAIYGHSMGSLLAFAWAAAIARAGLPAPACLIVSGRNAPQTAGTPDLLHALPDDAFLSRLEARYGAFAPGLLDDPELRQFFLPILRADLALVEDFRYQPEPSRDQPELFRDQPAPSRDQPLPPLACHLLALAGERDASVTDPGLAAWGELTLGDFHHERLPGDHFFHFGEGQSQLLELIVGRLARSS